MNCHHTAAVTFRSASASGNNDNGPNCVEVGPFLSASFSNPIGNCVEAAFTTASASGAAGHCVSVAYAKPKDSNGNGGNNCVEPGVAELDHPADCTPETCRTPGIEPGDVLVRDSKLGEGSPLIRFRPEQWRAYVAQVIEGGMEFDPTPHTFTAPSGQTRDDCQYVLRDPANPGNVLRFHPAEADAFRTGCAAGEFNYSQPVAVA